VRVFDTHGVEQTRFGGSEGWIAGNLFAAHSINLDREGPVNERPLPKGLHPALQKFRRL
jgi:hypothetical protein